MTKVLSDRIIASHIILDEVENAIQQFSAHDTLVADVTAYISRILKCRQDLKDVSSMLESRKFSFDYLVDLEEKVNDKDEVPYGTNWIPFRYARSLGCHAYIATSWSISDSLTKAIGLILCAQETGFNLGDPPQLVPDFIRDKKANKHIPALIFNLLKPVYGWPLGVSYAIRNHFMHDGGVYRGTDIFDSPTSAGAFNVSAAGWQKIVDKASELNSLNSAMHRNGLVSKWVDGVPGDFREILGDCEVEIDSALGLLLVSSCAFFRASLFSLIEID